MVILVDELVWLCCYLSTPSPGVSSVLARKATRTVGPYIPLPFVDVVGLVHVILFSNLIIPVQIILFFSTLVAFRWGQSKLYWSGGSGFMIMPYESNHCQVSAYQQ